MRTGTLPAVRASPVTQSVFFSVSISSVNHNGPRGVVAFSSAGAGW